MCSIQFKSINVRHCENTVLWCLFAAFISLGFICTWKNHSTFPLLAATQETNTSSFCFPSTYRDYRGTTHPRFYLTKTLILKLLWGHCVTNRSSHCGTESSVLDSSIFYILMVHLSTVWKHREEQRGDNTILYNNVLSQVLFRAAVQSTFKVGYCFSFSVRIECNFSENSYILWGCVCVCVYLNQ